MQKHINFPIGIILILLCNYFNTYSQLGCGTQPSAPPNPNVSVNCSRASTAFNQRYVQLASYKPDPGDNVKTIKISFNIFQDPAGGGTFTSNTLDIDYQNQRTYLTQTLLGWLNWEYSSNGSLDIYYGQATPTSDPIPGVVDIHDSKVRFDLGDPGHERIYYYPGNLWNLDDITGFRNTINSDVTRNDQYTTLNIYFSEGCYLNNCLNLVGGYATLPNYDDTWNQYIVLFGPWAAYYNSGSGSPDYQTARTLVHELGHILDLKHTYDPDAPCANTVDYLDDFFGPW